MIRLTLLYHCVWAGAVFGFFYWQGVPREAWNPRFVLILSGLITLCLAAAIHLKE